MNGVGNEGCFVFARKHSGTTTENQRLELCRVATAKGWEVTVVYEDQGISGAKGRDRRLGYDQMLKDAVKAKFDVVMAWDVSRLGRSLTGLVQALDELHSNRVALYLHQQALDTTTPSGKALFQMCGVFAEFERAMISERVKAGMRRARHAGKKLGRTALKIDEGAVRARRSQGATIRTLALIHGCSTGTIHRIVSSDA